MMNRTPQKFISNTGIPVTHRSRIISTVRHDPEQALREQLQFEIENKTKACAHTSYDCTLTRVDGFEYCSKHILQNPASPYKQCSYLFSNGRKCLEPAPKHSSKKDIGTSTYCFEHSRLSQLSKLRSTVGKSKPVETPETILSNLSKYVKLDGYRDGYYPGEPNVTPSIDPVLEPHRVLAPQRSILDFASDSESDSEPPNLSNTTRNYELDDSDNESVDSQSDDLLKHAGIYTTEEAAAITKEKLKKLQSLYIDQFQRLYHVLREKRRSYIHSLKRERETLSSIYNQILDTPEERENYKKLKAMNHYHRKFGVNAVLKKKLQEKRMKITDGMDKKLPYHNKCLFTEGGVKCGERAIPAAKHCRKHILEDKKQVLFRACGVEKADIVCQEPVPNVFENATCVLHMPCPEPRIYIHKKYQSDTEEEEEVLKEEKIKTETIDDGEVKMETETIKLENEVLDLADLNVEEMETNDDEVVMDDPTKIYTEPSFNENVVEVEEEVMEYELKVESEEVLEQ